MILAAKYRDEYGMEMKTATLARIMFAENPHVYKSAEDARFELRYMEGKAGSKKRNELSQQLKSKYFMAENRNSSPHSIPSPDSDDLQPLKLPLSFNDFILAGDFHVPNHRTKPIEAMMKYAKDNNVTKFILNGDLLDNTPFTRWMHEPITPSDVPRWFDMAKELLVYFKQQFSEIYFLEGNHDFWMKRYLMEKAQALFGDKYFHLESRLGLNELGIKFIDQRYLVKAGHLNIHHGHILFRGGGSYANGARMLYMKSKSNMICSHLHVESSHTEPDIDDKIATTFVTGCMCTLRPEYQPFGGKACHGFAHITVKPNRNFNVRNYRIYNGEIL